MGRVGVRQSIVSPASDIEATLSQELTEGSGYTLSSQKGAPGNGVRGSTPSLGITGWLCPDLYTNESPVASHRPSECGRPTSNNGA